MVMLATREADEPVCEYVKKVDDNYIYSQDELYKRQNGNIVWKPVPNIVFSAVLWPKLVSPDYFRENGNWAWIWLPLVLGATLAVLGQIAAIVYVFEMQLQIMERNNKDVEGQVNLCNAGGAVLLRIICVSVLCAVVLSEVKDSIQFCQWSLRLPCWDEDTENDHRDWLEKLQTGFGVQRKVIKSHGGVEFIIHHIELGHVSSRYQALMVLVGIVKACIELSILAGGAGYILFATSNENILLNAVSLVFILEIDDYMYRYMVTDTLKRFIENETPSITLIRGQEKGSQHHIHNWFQNDEGHLQQKISLILIFIQAICVGIVYTSWCV